ncbi:MAG TPA: YebC/PmpR family DNA-binding transcriptional regulator [Chthoniobacteraceae bacterium]|jgi:YebC/PmpR family DNA-binding regulatory protein|nr:YebC/PmpR family DNA-binding transcriptional regulator [Chthoniobacteraceae bacterium]
MAGHSKWSKVKRIKGALDVKRGKLFSKLSKEITVAARMGGGDPSGNPRLRAAVLAGRAQSMPNENIDRAIKRGTGEGDGAGHIEELVYEGYAPGGIALMVEVATDNKNRTAADLRLIFTKNHGNLGSSGSVGYLFRRRGQIIVPFDAVAEDRLLEIVLDAGADELTADGEHSIITTAPDQLYAVAEALKNAGVPSESQKLTYLPDTTVLLQDEAVAAQVLKLCDALEDNDDVQSVHANFDLPEELLAKLSA